MDNQVLRPIENKTEVDIKLLLSRTKLKPKAKKIILLWVSGKTQAEIGRELGLTRQYIWQVRTKFLRIANEVVQPPKGYRLMMEKIP